ncbi:hypothetical protein C6P45_005328 [Maudiozyma exigua]|uniref:Uncharacterized protein n=1 Tax=Maudiozyma exigua TaxID=34358 RepID=A0A9P6W9A8_MAUEX|nr:hypothetical protein C6P45_005328 [Kazachstania exigua]
MAILPKLNKEQKKAKIVKKHPSLKQSTHNDIKTIIYIKSSTPFVSGIKRVNKFLKNLEKTKKDPKLQCIMLLGMGKAAERTISLGCYFAEEKRKRIEIRTKSVDVIDEVISPGQEGDTSTPLLDDRDKETELKKRSLSGVEIKIYP